METHGEGGGGGAGRRGRSELGRLLEAIGSSEVLEKRIPLIKQLEEFSADDLDLIIQGLLESWIDSTCSGVSHCTLHRSILQVALKCSDLDITDYHLGQFLLLVQSSWCVEHLQQSVKPIDQSQVAQEEDHNRLRLEVNSLSISISTKLLDIAAKSVTVLGLEMAVGEVWQGAAAEKCVLNKAEDAFLTLEAMVAEVEPVPDDLAVGMPQEASRRCMHCVSEKAPQWRPGLDAPRMLCNACWHRFAKGQPLHSNSCCRSSNKRRPSKEMVGVSSENGHDMAMAPWSLAPLPQEASRRCVYCTSENTPRWLPGPDGPGTRCNVCGQLFSKGRLLHTKLKKRRSSSKENSAAGDDVAALLPCNVGAAMDAFFDHTGLETSWEEAGPAGTEEEEEEWLSNKDAFPSVEAMAVEVEDEWTLDVPRARTKVRRHVTANAVQQRGRCTHCAAEETPEWRQGPEGKHTLCNACGIVFRKNGRLPEYRPASSPGFSPLLHSRTYSRALEMHRQNEAFAAIRATAKARCAAACRAARDD